MKLQFLALAGLGSLVAAQPVNEIESNLSERSTSIRELATFDDLDPSPIAALNFVPTPYKNLNYSAFVYQSAGTDNIAPGVIPHSLPNYAANGEFARIRAGNPTLTVVGTNATSFDLHSFWYGCYITQPLEQAQVSTSCTFTVTAITTAGEYKPPVAFDFAKDNSLTALMDEAEFGSAFARLQSAIIEIIDGSPTGLTTDIVVDSVDYTVYGV